MEFIWKFGRQVDVRVDTQLGKHDERRTAFLRRDESRRQDANVSRLYEQCAIGRTVAFVWKFKSGKPEKRNFCFQCFSRVGIVRPGPHNVIVRARAALGVESCFV